VNEGRFIENLDVLPSLVPEISLDAHITNSVVGYRDMRRYSPVLPGIYPIPARTAWHIADGEMKIATRQYIPSSESELVRPFESIARRYVNLCAGSPIALELSGGLDSSLILAVITSVGFRPTLIGGRWSNFEMRTERKIQDILKNQFNLPTYFFEDKLYPFGDIMRVPRHILPNPACFYWNMHDENSKLCSQLGIKTILNGHGGDALLSDSLVPTGGGYMFTPWLWGLDWTQDTVYAAKGMRYLSAFALKSVARKIFSIRHQKEIAENEDRFKIVFRDLFSDRVPPELSKYYYKASGTALHLEGLQRAETQISEIYRAARDVYNDPRLTDRHFKLGMQKYSFMTAEEIKQFEATISFSCWIYSNLKN
jgi:hypothetical protein